MDLRLVKSGLYGLCIGDALGVPVEFRSRESLRESPVADMLGNGTYHQPAGTWSDDSSMTLALADSIGQAGGIDPQDMMERFRSWYQEGAYTPWGVCFDVGNATAQAIGRYQAGVAPALCGGTQERSNGNGSLMRILPLAYVLYAQYGPDLTRHPQAMETIHLVSSLTHRHPISLSACGIYLSVAARLLDGMTLPAAIAAGVPQALDWYRSTPDFAPWMDTWARIADPDALRALPEEEIRSSGYVVDTLEASLWCLLNTNHYRDSVLKAVNLGSDTDTTAAVTGGLAGLAYGLDAIPRAWLDQLAGQPLVQQCCDSLISFLERPAN